MPIYVYEPTIYSREEKVNDCCSFEVLQPISESALKTCPTCAHPIHRAVTTFQFKEGVFANKQVEPNKGNNTSSARQSAQLAAKHLCGAGCRH